MIKFIESSHQYFNESNLEYKSVTKWLSTFEYEVDWDYWKHYCALERLLGFEGKTTKNGYKWFGTWLKHNYPEEKKAKTLGALKSIAEKHGIPFTTVINTSYQIAWEWDNKTQLACEKGSDFHSIMENEAYDTGLDIVTPLLIHERPKRPDILAGMQGSVQQYNGQLLNEIPDGAYPELAVWHDKARIAGKIDKPFIYTIDGIRYVSISDYKTNDKLTFDNNFKSYYKFPINNIKVCKFNHYALQLNIYAFILGSWGFKLDKLYIEHNTVTQNQQTKAITVTGSKVYEVPNLQKEVQLMFNHRINQVALAA
jgi:hypothetical protein